MASSLISTVRDTAVNAVNSLTGHGSSGSSQSAKDSLKPKKVASESTTAGAKHKKATIGFRELNQRLNLTFPACVVHRSCQNKMPRLRATTKKSIIQGRAAALTAVTAIEHIMERIMQGAIVHSQRRGAKTVSLLDVQRSVLTRPSLARSLQYHRIASIVGPHPLGVVNGMTIAVKNKKSSKKTNEESDDAERPVAKQTSSKSKSAGKTQSKNAKSNKTSGAPKHNSSATKTAENDDSTSDDNVEEQPLNSSDEARLFESVDESAVSF